MKIQSRLTYGICFLFVVILLLISLYLQFFQGLMPCPLCSMQRLTFLFLGILFVLGIIFFRFPFVRQIINAFIFSSALLGITLAGRQIWLQHFPPPPNGECSPSLQYMLEVLPVNEFISEIFKGTAECSDQQWQFLYLNMAEWSLIWFLVFLGISVMLIFKRR